MVIVQLKGGIGNQLFQYALGKRIAMMQREQLFLDLSKFTKNSDRSYRLSKLQISASIAPTHLQHGYITKAANKNLPVWSLLFPSNRISIIEETTCNFEPSVLHIRGNCYLNGYWQSEKYFKPISQTIRAEFIPLQLSEGAKLVAERICDTRNAVSVHVRRGDYVTHPTARTVHGALPKAYYLKAVRRIEEEVKDPTYYIFSDDIAWCNNNLHLGPYTQVISTGQEYEDLYLMSMCRHHIIANSSFSWWGAWLNAKKGKKVIAPMRWFDHYQYTDRDVVPDEWERL